LALATLGVFGAALFFGDSMITPAISVLSAVEGLKIVEPKLDEWILPMTAVIIVALFAVQRRGTAAVGRLFGPVMIAWFVAIGACGVRGILGHPAILRALSPMYALEFMAAHFHIAFFALAAVVLAFTGAEALYADMGHFGRSAITWGWLALVLPACALNYFGQGALLLGDEATVSAPFFQWRPRPLNSDTCRGCEYCTPRRRGSARSTCRGSTGCSWWRCSSWCSRSAARRRCHTPMAWR
jgi:KUP system potassium uptake protein